MSKQKIYHGCDTVNEDGRWILINFKAGHRCVLPANDRFWKRPQDVTNKVETRTVENKKKEASKGTIKSYSTNLPHSDNN